MKRVLCYSIGIAAVLALGCTTGSAPINPFLTLAEAIGVDGGGGGNGNQGGGGGQTATDTFRRTMELTFANNHPSADLEFNYIAWVSSSSIRSAEQQDALLSNNYVQLRSEVKIGSVYALPPGTFVLNGPGTAGATKVELKQGASPETVELITPDAVLVFLAPPVSCDTVAFVFSRDGDPLTSEFTTGGSAAPFDGSNQQGGLKTLSQISAYQCEPLAPGLFLKIGGGARKDNEFFEGEGIRIDFNATPTDGNFAIVTIE